METQKGGLHGNPADRHTERLDIVGRDNNSDSPYTLFQSDLSAHLTMITWGRGLQMCVTRQRDGIDFSGCFGGNHIHFSDMDLVGPKRGREKLPIAGYLFSIKCLVSRSYSWVMLSWWVTGCHGNCGSGSLDWP